MARPKTKILVDGGDPQETMHVRELLGFVDGQTTNPSLIAKNPEIRQSIASGHKFSSKEEMDEYKKIVQAISLLVGDAGVSIEVFADQTTTAEEMFNQGREMYTWIPNAYIKYPLFGGMNLSLAKILSGLEINSLHTFLNPPICYDCCPCSAFFGFGSEHWLAAFAHARICSWRIWRSANNSRC